MSLLSFTCPVCEIKKNNSEKSNGRFNERYICKDCMKIINRARGGQREGQVMLEDLKEIVKNNIQREWSDNIKMQYGVLLNDFDILDKETQNYILLENEYEDKLSMHFSFLEQEDMLYSTAINLPKIDNETTRKCLEVCLQDISLAPEIKEYYTKKNDTLPQYPAFYYACQLYDKLGDLDNAIMICKEAIDLGYYRDNSKGGMPARMAKLITKKSKQDKNYKAPEIKIDGEKEKNNTKQKKCGKCHKINSSDSNFCISCGNKLK